jgi:hypothetical protein
MAARAEGRIRFQPYGDVVKHSRHSAFYIDHVQRFNRDYGQEQRTAKRALHDLTLAAAGARRGQNAHYVQYIEGLRKEEAKLTGHYSQTHFGRESVFYDPATNIVPQDTTQNGKSPTAIDTRRESRALQIEHRMHSAQYDRVNGEVRAFWQSHLGCGRSLINNNQLFEHRPSEKCYRFCQKRAAISVADGRTAGKKT